MMNNSVESEGQMIDSNRPLGDFSGDEDFYLEYAESLMEGDIRPIVIKDYVEGNE